LVFFFSSSSFFFLKALQTRSGRLQPSFRIQKRRPVRGPDDSARGRSRRKHSAKISFARLRGHPDPYAALRGGIFAACAARKVMTTKKAYEICLRLSEKETQALKEKAKQCGLSKSAYLRRLILDKPVKARPPEAVHELYVEINRIGTNINQIARACNAGMTDPGSAAAQALFLLQKVYALMDGAASGFNGGY
jgi:hypothetical protein